MQLHNLGENAVFTTLASGTFVGANFGGTLGGVLSAGLYEYTFFGFFGTIANTGTINVYACTNSGGSGPVVLKSLVVGSGDGGGAGIDVRSNTLGSLNATGTTYTHLSVAGTVDSGGTWRGALTAISYWPKTAPTTNNLVAYGSSLY